jgi:hypothetical protein
MMNQKNYFDQMLASFKRSRPKPYTPRFHIRREGKDWRIFDGDRAIALFMPHLLDIWSFSPFEPDEMANVDPPGKVVDLHTMHNTVINFGAGDWPAHWLTQGKIDDLLKWTWLKKRGPELVVRISVDVADGESARWLLRIRYDAAWGRYRYTWDIDVRKFDSDFMEAFNLMTAGALADRPEKLRWTHSIWENADGELRRIVHSVALLGATDYASGPTNDPGGPWRYRNVSYPRAWIGYAAHKSFNPVVLIHQTNAPLTVGICSALFDEHICWTTAGQDNLDENGYFHFQMKVELVNLGPALAKKFLAAAKDPVKPKPWRHKLVALPFYLDRVNTFEKEIDVWKATDCAPLFMRTAHGITWDKIVGHTGTHSIRLDATEMTQRRELFPDAVCCVLPHRRYRLTGWIRTRGVESFARIELAAIQYSQHNIVDYGRSIHISGDRKWTRVVAELDTAEEAYVIPRLVLYGPGTAWFDDLNLELVA